MATNPASNHKTTRAKLIFSYASFGTIALFVRNVPLSSGEIALHRAVLASILVGLFMLLTKQGVDFRKMKNQLPLLFASGFAMGFNWILLFQAYKYTTVSVATLSYYFAPVIVTAVCPFLFKEKLTGKQIVCFVMSTLGVALIIGFSGFGSSGTDLIGILFGLGAACLYATVTLLNKFIKGVEDIPRTFLQFIAAVVVLLPYVAFTGGFHLGELGTFAWINLLILGLFHTGITYCLYFGALKDTPGQEASVLSYTDPVVSVIVSVLLLGEPITPVQIIGGFMILGFAFWNEISTSKE